VASSRTPRRIGCTATALFEATADSSSSSDVYRRLPRRSVTACAAQRQESRRHRPLRALHRRARDRERLLELNDPEDQAARFEEQAGRRLRATRSPCTTTPTTSAPGVRSAARGRRRRRDDRLVMLFTKPSIRDVLLFPICAGNLNLLQRSNTLLHQPSGARALLRVALNPATGGHMEAQAARHTHPLLISLRSRSRCSPRGNRGRSRLDSDFVGPRRSSTPVASARAARRAARRAEACGEPRPS